MVWFFLGIVVYLAGFLATGTAFTDARTFDDDMHTGIFMSLVAIWPIVVFGLLVRFVVMKLSTVRP